MFGMPACVTNAAGKVIVYELDATGHVTEITTADGIRQMCRPDGGVGVIGAASKVDGAWLKAKGQVQLASPFAHIFSYRHLPAVPPRRFEGCSGEEIQNQMGRIPAPSAASPLHLDQKDQVH
jgi:YD repeat-containing protein